MGTNYDRIHNINRPDGYWLDLSDDCEELTITPLAESDDEPSARVKVPKTRAQELARQRARRRKTATVT